MREVLISPLVWEGKGEKEKGNRRAVSPMVDLEHSAD